MWSCEAQENNGVWHMVMGMELLKRNHNHSETGRGMMGDCASCPGRDRLGMMVVVVAMTRGDGFGR